MRTGPVAIAVMALGASAHANPAAIVPSGAESGTAASFTLDYEYQLDRSKITRERVGDPSATPLGPPPKFDDLEFSQYRHLLTPRVDVGIAPDTWFTVALPIVIAQARELRLASGVDRSQSSTLEDGFLPQAGVDATDLNNPPQGDLVFRGVNRSGLSYIKLGLGIAPMNQRRDDTKPTWKIGVDVNLAVGRIMRFDRMNPTAETGVSTGVHELRLWTSIDRKIDFVEPWFEVFWQAPIAARANSLFSDPGFGSTNVMLGQTAGLGAGLEVYAVDDSIELNKLSIELSGHVTGHFEGRGYSEMWEVFAYAGDSRVEGNPLVLDQDPTTPGLQALSHPGITNIENYLEVAGRIALRAQLGPKVHVGAIVDVIKKTDHAITFADSGVDLPTCGTPGASAICEMDQNDVVNPGTREVNPLHVKVIDLVGHRYLSEGGFGLVIGIQGQFVF